MSNKQQDSIEMIYDTTQHPELWENVLSGMIESTHSKGGTLIIEDHGGGQTYNGISIGMSDSAMEDYGNYYSKINMINKILGDFSTEEFWTLDQVIRFPEFANTEFYADYCRPENIRYMIGGYICNLNGIGTRLGLQRGHGEFDFKQQEIDFINSINCHLSTAIQAQTTLGNYLTMTPFGAHSIEQSPTAMALVDERMKLLYYNEAFDHYLHKSSAFSSHASKLYPHRDIQSWMNNTISDCIKSSQGEDTTPEQMCNYFNGNGGQLTEINIAPFSTSDPTLTLQYRKSLALITARDVQRNFNIQQDSLAYIYALSQKELEIIALLCSGQNVASISQYCKISERTVRSHIQAILQKTACKNQTELICLSYSIN